MKKTTIFTLALFTGISIACNNGPGAAGEETDSTDVVMEEKPVKADVPEEYTQGNIKIYPAAKSPEYADAKLELKMPETGAAVKSPVKFDFEVSNYELGVQTSDAADKGLANSDKGQHIHLIVDNGPYSAHYEPDFEKEFDPGHHIAIAFLSRSYHESVKNGSAHKVFQFTVGDAAGEQTDLSQPMLFYSRPKGDYTGAGTNKILFDFFPVNADLGAGKYSVKLTINNNMEFEFDTWQPYYVEGLPMGENTFKIDLIDDQGNVVTGPVTSATRTFTLSE